MDADWYEDPLGRYDGRFFDGHEWTARVSLDGLEKVDTEFPPASDNFEHAGHAVEPVDAAVPRRATLAAESPVRTVAVLDESILNGVEPRRRPSLWMWILLGALVAVAVVAFFLLRSNSDVDGASEDRLEDLEAGGVPVELGADDVEDLASDAETDQVTSGADFDESQAVTVGALEIVNGAAVLGELEAWHQGYAAERGVNLTATAGCWFGELGDAAVQVAQCGPVGEGPGGEYLFDLVPLSFDETDDGAYVAMSVVGDVTPDAVLANTLRLVGHSGSAAPPLSLDERGGRDGTGDN